MAARVEYGEESGREVHDSCGCCCSCLLPVLKTPHISRPELVEEAHKPAATDVPGWLRPCSFELTAIRADNAGDGGAVRMRKAARDNETLSTRLFNFKQSDDGYVEKRVMLRRKCCRLRGPTAAKT